MRSRARRPPTLNPRSKRRNHPHRRPPIARSGQLVRLEISAGDLQRGLERQELATFERLLQGLQLQSVRFSASKRAFTSRSLAEASCDSTRELSAADRFDHVKAKLAETIPNIIAIPDEIM